MNKEIYEARMRGETIKKLSEKYNLSERNISCICFREERNERLKEQRYYQILASLIEDEQLLTRVLHVIERNNFDSDEAILEVNKEQLLRCRNCGTASVALILKTAEILRNETNF